MFQKKCTKFKHHSFATVHHTPFSAKCSEIKCYNDKGHCLNAAIKYSLLFSWQVICLKTKQSTWYTSRFAFKRSFMGVRRHPTVKNLFIQEPSMSHESCSESRIRFFALQTLACIQSFQFVCCCQRLNFTASKH